jgi:hypothetical protein
MSRNGRWLAIGRTRPTIGVTRFEILPQTIRPAGIVTEPIVTNVASLSAFDDGTVAFACKENSRCVWDGTSATELPASVGPGQNGRYLYYWTGQAPGAPYIQKLQQFDRITNTSIELSAECPKRTVYQNAPSGRPDYVAHVIQSTPPLSDVSGRLVQFECGTNNYLFDSLTTTSIPLPPNAVLNSTFTRILSRPSPTTFGWASLGTAITPIDLPDSIRLRGIATPAGMFSTVGNQDFTINWGGHALPWLKGALGYAYAPLPADLVPGASDAVAVVSTDRPWLNTTIQQKINPPTPYSLPLVASDPLAVFIHGDYRGFVTPTTPAKRGDFVHLLITGVKPGEVTPEALLNCRVSVPRPGLPYLYSVSLPVVAFSPTLYHSNISQLTLRIPEDALPVASPDRVVSCSNLMVANDGRTTYLNVGGYLAY